MKRLNGISCVMGSDVSWEFWEVYVVAALNLNKKVFWKGKNIKILIFNPRHKVATLSLKKCCLKCEKVEILAAAF